MEADNRPGGEYAHDRLRPDPTEARIRTRDLEDVLETCPVLRPSELVPVHDPVLNRSPPRVLQHGIAGTRVDRGRFRSAGVRDQ